MKKSVFVFVLFALVFLGMNSHAHDSHHVKHNMVLFGESEIFASHIVYKVPHNYQVILKVELDAKTKTAYLMARKEHPRDEFIFLLDETRIADIEKLSSISGTIFRTDSNDQRTVIADHVTIGRDAFSLLFFNELPLSLD